MRLCPCLHWLMKSQTEGMLLQAPPVRHDFPWHGNWGHCGSRNTSCSASVSGSEYMLEYRDLLCCFVVLSLFVPLFCLSLSIYPPFFCSLYFIGNRKCSSHRTTSISKCPRTQAIFPELNDLLFNILIFANFYLIVLCCRCMIT